MPPENMAIDMRTSKLKPEEAAILAGELNKPSWESRNEGIHERVSFEDTIWGFDLAGGSYYQTALRVTFVKPGSRAEKAGIRPGDRLKRINDIDTSTLTIHEAHDIIVASGVHLKIAVTAPEDEEDAYFCYEDPIEDGYDSEEERRLRREEERKKQIHARVSHYWSLQWPWVSKRKIIYRESNCFLVPSKFEEKNRAKFPTQSVLKVTDDVVLHSTKSEKERQQEKDKPNALFTNPIIDENNLRYTPTPKEIVANGQPVMNGYENKKEINTTKINEVAKSKSQVNGSLKEIPETDEDMNSIQEDLTEEISQVDEEQESKDQSVNDISANESYIENENVEHSSEMIENSQQEETLDSQKDESIVNNEDVENDQRNEDEIISEILEDENVKGEEETTVESMLSDSEINSQSDER